MTPRSIPVARPKLPDADALLPHLRAIDARRSVGLLDVFGDERRPPASR